MLVIVAREVRMDDGRGDRGRRERMEKASHEGHSFQTNQTQPRQRKLSSASSAPAYQEHTSLAVRGLNIQWTKPTPGRVNVSMSAEHAPRNGAANTSFSLPRPLSIPDLYRNSNPSIYGFDAFNPPAANTSLQARVEDYSEEQRVAFPKPRIMWSRKSSASNRSCSGEGEREGGYDSIQPFRPIKVPDRLRKSTSSSREVAELDMNLPFPAKLHYIISNPKYKKFISWCSHGRAWRVLKQRGFERHVIPIFFRSDKFASFMRQVNGWAFVRMTQGPDVNCYYHEMFLRVIPSLAFNMRRPPKVKNAASTARKQAGAGFGTPDFYRISRIAPLPPVIPYKIELKPSKREGGDQGPTETEMVDPATRYMIVPLEQQETDSFEPLEDFPNATQILETQKHGYSESVSFVDPFSSEGSEDEDSLIGVDGGVTSSMRSLSSGSVSEVNSAMRGLSEADISYLAHQNRRLLKHM